MREAPSRLLGRLRKNSSLRDRDRFGLKDFHVLEETPDEIAFGLMGQFWRSNYGLITVATTQSFASYAEPGSARLVMSYAARRDSMDSFPISTETRICCQDTRARLSFLPYWLLIRPVSGWIRRRVLEQLKVDAMRRFSSSKS